MPLNVRTYTPADRDGFANVRSKVYRGGVPMAPEEEVMRPDTFGTLGELKGKIVAVETDIDMSCTVRGEVVKNMGVAGVGVVPEARRGGIGLELLTKALPLYRERGAKMASLMPFRAQYYRKVGYATAGSRMSVKCPAYRFSQFEQELEVWELPIDDHSAIIPCYEAFCRQYSGMNVRGPGQWRWQLGGDNRFAIYAAGDPPEAYMSTRLKVDFWVEQEVRDLVWSTPRGYRSILAFLRGLCMNKTSAQWTEPAQGPMLWRYDDQGLEIKFEANMMYRALDVCRLLETVRSEESGEFLIAVDDPHLSDNRGPWHVRFHEGTTEVERADDADFELSIGAFTQAILGEPSLDAIAGHGAVQVRNEAAFRAACRFLRPFPTYCLDYF